MESMIGLHKTDLIKPGSVMRNWPGPREVECKTAEWVHWYNNERLQFFD
ncbi:hypothetical protein FRAHR75_680042 [Frankia sp. Hr75.2]|nr:hypothetical protein FRAHR75_680042 [Frankia sp. Hr75.2]